jgi:predicted AAA+ superfamily ATPase
MDTLEYYYNIEFKKIDYLDRKKHITKTNTIIYGPRFSGKSYMLYDLLSSIESSEYIYIDLNDYRVSNISHLEEFIINKGIKVLAIDNFDYSFELPKRTINLITSDRLVPLKGYKKIKFTPSRF